MGSKLILHIGTHKTGTTALQAALANNAALLDDAGYIYPLMPEKWPHIKRERNAYWLSMAALQEIESAQARHIGKIPACLECFTQTAAASEKTIVLSDERMWYCGTKKSYWRAVRRIAEDAGIEDIRIVVYLRRQDLFAESLWAQYVKGNTRLDIGLSEYLSTMKLCTICDYAAGYKRLSSVFGAENITVRVYDRELLSGGDIVEDFLALLGIQDVSSVKRVPASSNDTLSPAVTTLKLAINKVPSYQEAGSNYLLPVLRAASAKDEIKRGSFMTPEQRHDFLRCYEEGNAQLAEMLFGRSELFTVKPGELDRPAIEIGTDTVARQAAEIIVAAHDAQQQAHEAEVAKLKTRIAELERAERMRFWNRAKRWLKRKLVGNAKTPSAGAEKR